MSKIKSLAQSAVSKTKDLGSTIHGLNDKVNNWVTEPEAGSLKAFVRRSIVNLVVMAPILFVAFWSPAIASVLVGWSFFVALIMAAIRMDVNTKEDHLAASVRECWGTLGIMTVSTAIGIIILVAGGPLLLAQIVTFLLTTGGLLAFWTWSFNKSYEAYGHGRYIEIFPKDRGDSDETGGLDPVPT